MGGTKAIEVAAKASSLNSNDAFVLKTAGKCFIWEGIGASEIETEAADIVASKYKHLKFYNCQVYKYFTALKIYFLNFIIYETISVEPIGD